MPEHKLELISSNFKKCEGCGKWIIFIKIDGKIKPYCQHNCINKKENENNG